MQPSRAIRNLEHLQLKESTIQTAICGLADVRSQLKALVGGGIPGMEGSGLSPGVARMRIVTDYTEVRIVSHSTDCADVRCPSTTPTALRCASSPTTPRCLLSPTTTTTLRFA